MQAAFRALAMLLALGSPAAAAEATAEQAATLQAQVQAALRDQFRGLPGTPAPTVRMRPAGDEYDVTVTLEGQDATATARQGAAGAWEIRAIHLPSPTAFRIGAPQVPVQLAIDIGSQEASAVFSPGFTAASSFLGRYGSVSLSTAGPQGRSVSHIDACTISGAATPLSDGRTDVTERLSLTGYDSTSHMASGGDGRMRARAAEVRLRVAALSPEAATAVSRAWAHLLTVMYPALQAGLPPAWDDRTRTAAYDLVQSVDGLLHGLDLTETADGVTLGSPDAAISLAHASLGLAAAAPQGTLDARLAFDLAGLAIPSVPRAQGGDLIPRNVSFQPVLSGIDMRALQGIALSATAKANPGADVIVQLLAMLSQGGIGLGLEHIAVDLGPAHIAGDVRVQLAGLTSNSGEGRITATGFDALIARLRDLPSAATLLPTLAGLRAAAHQDGEALVWDLRLKDGRVLVNGTDLASLRKRGKP